MPEVAVSKRVPFKTFNRAYKLCSKSSGYEQKIKALQHHKARFTSLRGLDNDIG